MNWETYIAFGDSITIGARTYLGYPELTGNVLKKNLSKEWNVINHSVSGFKAIDLARYIDKYFFILKDQKASVSTILIGTNDIKENTDANDFKIALDQIILKAKLLTENKNVILLSLPVFPKGIMYPYSIGMNQNILFFNSIISEKALEHKIRTLTLDLLETDFTDGVHLNRSGVESVSNQLAKYILKDKGVEIG